MEMDVWSAIKESAKSALTDICFPMVPAPPAGISTKIARLAQITVVIVTAAAKGISWITIAVLNVSTHLNIA